MSDTAVCHDADRLADGEVLSMALEAKLEVTTLRAHTQVTCVAVTAGTLLLEMDGHAVGRYSCDDSRTLLRPCNSSVHVVKSCWVRGRSYRPKFPR